MAHVLQILSVLLPHFSFPFSPQIHRIALTLSMTQRYFPFAYKKFSLISKLILFSSSLPFFECLPSLVAEYLERLHWARRDTFRDTGILPPSAQAFLEFAGPGLSHFFLFERSRQLRHLRCHGNQRPIQ